MMDKETFFREVVNKLPKEKDVRINRTDDQIEVCVNNNSKFIIGNTSRIAFPSNTVYTNELNLYYDKTIDIIETVKEYITAMENAENLKAIDFDMPYKKLAEFNGVVLGGVKQSNGEFHFTTWERKRNALYFGHYYGVEYKKAKEDFAIRSRLVDNNKIFTEKQLIEMYRCIKDMIQKGTVSFETEAILQESQKQIENIVSSIKGIVSEMNIQEPEMNL